VDLGAHFAGRRCTPEHPAAPLNVLALYGGAGQNQRVIRNWNVDALVQASDGHNDSSKLTEAPNDHISIARHPRVEGECWESGREALIDDGIELCSVVAVDLALRARLAAVPGADALVGGPTAIALDTDRGAAHDRRIVFPLVLLVVLAVLGLLLRSLLAPVLLTATVVVSFAASFGLSALIFRYVLGFAGTDQGVPLYAFIFLVALGVDYNIFLMSRAREEAQRHGLAEGTRRSLALTGTVITSAGIVLAATFGVLALLPIVIMIEVGISVALGILLDTLVVRSILVPALSLDIGRWMWWPARLGKPPPEPSPCDLKLPVAAPPAPR